MLLIILQCITFARPGATAGAINFNKGELIPSSPVATFDGSDLMISKTSCSETVGILKSAKLPAFFAEIHQIKERTVIVEHLLLIINGRWSSLVTS